MTLTDIGGVVYVPEIRTTTESNVTLDASDEKAAAVIRIPQTGTLKKICFGTATVTTGDTVNIRIETVDAASGEPTGSLYDANGTGSQAVGNSDDNTLFWVQINGSSGISVTAGDIVAIVVAIDYVDGSLQLRIASTYVFPYGLTYTTGAWAKGSTFMLEVALEYSTGVVNIYAYPPFTITSPSIDNATTPTIVGNRFTLPMGVRVVALWARVDLDGDANIVLYGSDGYTELASVSLDKDVRGNTTVGVFVINITPTELLANTYYRVAIRPTSTTNLSPMYITVADDGAVKGIDALPFGQNIVLTTSDDNIPDAEGDWTQSNVSRCMCGIVIDQIDLGAGAGGIMGHRGMTGGLQ